MRAVTLGHWYMDGPIERYAELDVLVSEPDPQTGWPGDIERDELRIDGEVCELWEKKYSAIADEIIELEQIPAPEEREYNSDDYYEDDE